MRVVNDLNTHDWFLITVHGSAYSSEIWQVVSSMQVLMD